MRITRFWNIRLESGQSDTMRLFHWGTPASLQTKGARYIYSLELMVTHAWDRTQKLGSCCVGKFSHHHDTMSEINNFKAVIHFSSQPTGLGSAHSDHMVRQNIMVVGVLLLLSISLYKLSLSEWVTAVCRWSKETVVLAMTQPLSLSMAFLPCWGFRWCHTFQLRSLQILKNSIKMLPAW